MDRFVFTSEFLVKFLGEEWCERGQENHKQFKHRIQGRKGSKFIFFIGVFAETTARTTDIPVAEVVYERQDAIQGFRDIVFLHTGSDFVAELVDAQSNPAI